MRRTFIIFVSSIFLIPSSCSLDEESGKENLMYINLSPSESATEGTRSLLPETESFEDGINNVSAAAYNRETGYIEAAKYFDAGPYSLSLDKSKTYNFYFVANMGDRSMDFPAWEKDIPSFRYELSSFGDMMDGGIPMAGQASSPWESTLHVSLRRLVAKVTVTIDHSDIDSGGHGDSFESRKIEVCRAARGLYPFKKGKSAAQNAEDIFTVPADCQTVSGTDGGISEELILYIPENMQGPLLEGNTDPDRKSESSPGLDASLCTYLNVTCSKTGAEDGVGGQLLYRFFPGENNTDNFDIEGNKTYRISLVLTWDGMFMTDNWKVDKTSWSDNRRIQISMAPDRGYSGEITGIPIAKGSSNVPVYIYYSPQGLDYKSEELESAGHCTSGWTFSPMGSPITLEPDEIFTDGMISTGFLEEQPSRTKHFITIAENAAPGTEGMITYQTSDRRKSASLRFLIAEPSLYISPSVIECPFNDFGKENIRIISILPESSVRPNNVNISSNGPITIDHYDETAGTVHVYWNEMNTSDSIKTATLTISGLDESAVCTLRQHPLFIIEKPENNGAGDIEY